MAALHDALGVDQPGQLPRAASGERSGVAHVRIRCRDVVLGAKRGGKSAAGFAVHVCDDGRPERADAHVRYRAVGQVAQEVIEELLMMCHGFWWIASSVSRCDWWYRLRGCASTRGVVETCADAAVLL